ncbi:M23 family metallopeptidase [Mumia sp. zg.B53]|uniref:M23 family metallopeptidase n=1 Tax=unclassified Mumia TaxID=2621872 RepID=UPI001C6F0509|nr:MULTISPECIES: M23 family metallopeptidase [unclassified Mumia]MBW9215980.1 M23 family metallopeptidase [Mumia sp. zg.B53]
MVRLVIPRRAGTRVRTALVLCLLIALTGAAASPTLGDDKDDLKNRRNQVQSEISGAQAELDQSSAQLAAATRTLQSSQVSLSSAQTSLATTRVQLAAAQARDAAMQAALLKAQAELVVAKKDAKRGRRSQRRASRVVERMTVESLQGGSPSLRAFSALVNGVDPAAYGKQVSLDQAVTDARLAKVDTLEATSIVLDLHREKVQKLRDEVKVKREEAAENLATQQRLEKDAREQEAEVAQLVQANAVAQTTAQQARSSDAAQLAALESERSSISGRLKAIAAAERAALARAEARERARQRKEAQKKRDGSGGGGNGGGSASGNSGNSGNSGGGGGGGGGGGSSSGNPLSYPVSAPITSSYGMRFHPVLHYWKLHDGTDFGAACGTPVRAAAGGRVVDRYFNAGYGNRVIIAHGQNRGYSVATTYNHLSRFSARPGERVQRGEVIGYVGSTGYSTGCHLHFMVLLDGDTTNPMKWL